MLKKEKKENECQQPLRRPAWHKQLEGVAQGRRFNPVREAQTIISSPFGEANQSGCALLVFHNMKTHPDVSSATGIKSGFETFLVDPQNAKNQNC